MRDAPEWLLFDLGEVLVDFSGFRDVGPLLAAPVAEDEIRARWSVCPVIRAFEIGALSPAQFAERFVADWGVTIPPERFLAEFRSWTRGLLPGACELLDALRGRHRVACLSNSNETHWERNTHEHGISGLFDAAFSSHELGLHKPDPAIYHAVLERLEVAPRAVVFFDDSERNVAAARDVGLRAFRVRGVAAVRERLVAEGLLAGL